ncbi:MAG TPA: hypothetical protein VNL98_02360 [Gemmatimonadales bacterium]|nr:hypothetical protein [Gemmatimonadales bacterium]
MFSLLLPQRIDNTYRGYKLGLWLFAVVVLMKVAMSLNSVFNGYSVATSADGIPLDTFPSGAARTVVALFALLGLSHFIFALLGVLALVRYRSMIPIMLTLLLLQQLSKKLILQFVPIVRTGTPPGFYVNLVLLAAIIVGLALSLRSQATGSATVVVPPGAT